MGGRLRYYQIREHLRYYNTSTALNDTLRFTHLTDRERFENLKTARLTLCDAPELTLLRSVRPGVTAPVF